MDVNSFNSVDGHLSGDRRTLLYGSLAYLIVSNVSSRPGNLIYVKTSHSDSTGARGCSDFLGPCSGLEVPVAPVRRCDSRTIQCPILI